MTKEDDIIRMAIEAGWDSHQSTFDTRIKAFAALVTKHTLANIDPSSFMSWQEGYEAGKQIEREACAKWCETLTFIDGRGTAEAFADEVRNRGQE